MTHYHLSIAGEIFPNEVWRRKADAIKASRQTQRKMRAVYDALAYETLGDVTGHESGVIYWGDDETWLGNWAIYSGLPRALGPIYVGLGGKLTAKPCDVPEGAIDIMRAHEASPDGGSCTDDMLSVSDDLQAWTVSDGSDTVTVVISDGWA